MSNSDFRSRRISASILIILAAALVSGCYWLRYHDLMLTHVDLMERMAVDAGAALRELPAGSLGADDIERLRYPMERAQHFASIVRRRYPDRVSLRRFDEFVNSYSELHAALDRLRVSELDESSLTAVTGLVDAAQARARAVRSAVSQERE